MKKYSSILVHPETKELLTKFAKRMKVSRAGLLKELAKSLYNESQAIKTCVTDEETMKSLYATGRNRWAELEEFVKALCEKQGITQWSEVNEAMLLKAEGYGISKAMFKRMVSNLWPQEVQRK